MEDTMTTDVTTPALRVRLTRLLGGRLRLTVDFSPDSDRTVLSLVNEVLEQAIVVPSNNTPGKTCPTSLENVAG